MHLIFIFGPVASGKHTIGNLLSEKTSIPLFHNHLTVDLVTTLFEFGSPGFVELRDRIWTSAFEIAVKNQQSLIFTFAPERTVKPDFVSRTRQIVEKNGGSIIFIELICPESEILGRIENPNRKTSGKISQKDLYQQLKQQNVFEYEMGVSSNLRIDTSTQKPEHSVALIEEHLNSI